MGGCYSRLGNTMLYGDRSTFYYMPREMAIATLGTGSYFLYTVQPGTLKGFFCHLLGMEKGSCVCERGGSCECDFEYCCGGGQRRAVCEPRLISPNQPQSSQDSGLGSGLCPSLIIDFNKFNFNTFQNISNSAILHTATLRRFETHSVVQCRGLYVLRTPTALRGLNCIDCIFNWLGH